MVGTARRRTSDRPDGRLTYPPHAGGGGVVFGAVQRQPRKGTTVAKCQCENSHCGNCNGRSECAFPASTVVECMFIGGICDACATFMSREYLHAIGTHEPVGYDYVANVWRVIGAAS